MYSRLQNLRCENGIASEVGGFENVLGKLGQ